MVPEHSQDLELYYGGGSGAWACAPGKNFGTQIAISDF